MPAQKAAKLEEWIVRRLPSATNIRVTDLAQPSSGLSAETLIFTVSYNDPGPRLEKLVMRSGPKGRGIFPDYDLSLQVGVMRALQGTSTPAPIVRWYEPDATFTGSPFVVMEHVEGEVPSDTPPGFHGQGLYFNATESERAAMWRAGLAQTAKLQALDWRALDLPALPGKAPDVEGSMVDQMRMLKSWVRWGEFEDLEPIRKGFEWFEKTPAPPARLSLVWGDARPGNIIHQNGRPAALLDWEIASIGLAEFDLFYWWWSSELLAEVNAIERLPGLPDKAETIAIFEDYNGRPIQAAEYAETFTVFRLAIMGALGVRASVSDIYSNDYVMNNAAMKTLQLIVGA